jgi:2-amino-4-hydroxy-6-hydroxymethyldihydropteridine diphosphokinase
LAEAYLALGSNVGDRRGQMRHALSALAERGVCMRRISSLYETEPMYEPAQPPFLNAVFQAETALTPEELLTAAKSVERDLGRQQRARFGPREIDIDILLYGNERRSSEDLTLPHPRMRERPFVQVPLAELLSQPAGCSGGVRRLEGPEWAGDLHG